MDASVKLIKGWGKTNFRSSEYPVAKGGKTPNLDTVQEALKFGLSRTNKHQATDLTCQAVIDSLTSNENSLESFFPPVTSELTSVYNKNDAENQTLNR